MSKTSEFFDNAKSEAKVAGYLVISDELIAAVKKPLAKYVAETMDSADVNKTTLAVMKFFNSEVGEMILQYMLAGILDNVPIPKLDEKHRAALAKGSRVLAYKKAGHKIASLLTGPTINIVRNHVDLLSE